MADPTPNNNASEKIEVTISGDGKIITLAPKAFKAGSEKRTPNYSLPTSDPQNRDVDLEIDYKIDNIMLDVQDEDKINAVSLDSAFETIAASKTACKKTRFFKEY